MTRPPVHFEDLPVGRVLESAERELTLEDMTHYNALTHSSAAVHDDVELAAQFGFRERLIPGPFILAASLPLHGLAADHRAVALLGFESISFKAPAYPGDRIRLLSEVKAARLTSKADRGLVTYRDVVRNQRDEVVMEATRLVLYERRDKGAAATPAESPSTGASR